MKKRAIINVFWGIVSKIVAILGPFAIRTIIIYKLGSEYMGLSSLFTSILNVLSLAELGFGSALTFSLYKPANDNDLDKMGILLNFYKKIYRIISGVVLVLGIIVTPFIKFLIFGSYPTDINVYILFLIYLLNTVLSYSLFAYKSSLLFAQQENYAVYAVNSLVQILMYGLQAIVLLVTKNYYFYIILLPISTLVINLIINYLTIRKYPSVKVHGELSAEERGSIYSQIKALFGHKLAGVVITSLDNIIISLFLGLVVLAKFSNYYYIITAITAFVDISLNAILSTIGKKILNSSNEDNYKLFMKLSLLSSILILTCSLCLFNLYQPFIALWTGEEGLFSNGTMLLFCLYFIALKIRCMTVNFRDAAGLWEKDKIKSYLGMMINLILNIILINVFEINGVLLATIIVMFFLFIPWETIVLFKFLFKCSMKRYLIGILCFIILSIVGYASSYLLWGVVIFDNSILTIIARLFLSLIISLVCFVVPFTFTREMKSIRKEFRFLFRKHKGVEE